MKRRLLRFTIFSILFFVVLTLLSIFRLCIAPTQVNFLTEALKERIFSSSMPFQIALEEISIQAKIWDGYIEASLKNVGVELEKNQSCLNFNGLKAEFLLSNLWQKKYAPHKVSLYDTSLTLRQKEKTIAIDCINSEQNLSIPLKASAESSDAKQDFSQKTMIGHIEMIEFIRSDVVFYTKENDFFHFKDSHLFLDLLPLSNVKEEYQYSLYIDVGELSSSLYSQYLSHLETIEFKGGYDFEESALEIQHFQLKLNREKIEFLQSIPILKNLSSFGFKGHYDFDRKKMDIQRGWLETQSEDYIHLRGHVDFIQKEAFFPSIFMDVDGPVGNIDLAITSHENQFDLSFKIAFFGLDVPQLISLWPETAAASGREWVQERVTEGNIINTFAKINLGLDADTFDLNVDEIKVQAWLDDMSVTFMPGYPQAKNVEGWMVLDQQKAVFDVFEGNIENKAFINKAEIILKDLDKKGQWVDINADARGELKDYLYLIDLDPLGYLKKIDFKPKNVQGQLNTSFFFSMPTLKDLSFNDVDLDIKASIQKAGLSGLPLDFAMSGGSLNLDVNHDRLVLNGEALLDGTKTDIEWQENFKGQNKWRSHYRLKANLTDTFRKDHNIKLDPYFSGNMFTDVIIKQPSNGDTDISMKLNLTDTLIQIPQLDLKKERSIPAQGNFSFKLKKDKVLPGFVYNLNSQNIDVKGTGLFENGQFDIAKLDLEHFRWDKQNLRGYLHWKANNSQPVLDINIRGTTFDISPLLDDSGEDDAKTFINVRAQIDKMIFGEEKFLSMVSATFIQNPQDIQKIEMRGNAGRAPFTLLYEPKLGSGAFSLKTSDAGHFLSAVGALDGIEGGKLIASGSMKGTALKQGIAGTINIQDFQGKDIPFLLKIVSLAGITGVVDMFSGPGVSFKELDVGFDYTNRRLNFSEGRVAGPTIGFTFSGFIDQVKQIVDLKGTIIPAYMLNSLISGIPVIGDILTDGPGGGIVAINFSVTGSSQNPKVSTNPLSTLTPGIFRKIFGE